MAWLELLYMADGMSNGVTAWEDYLEVSVKLITYVPYDPEIPLLEMNVYVPKKGLVQECLTSALFIIDKN